MEKKTQGGRPAGEQAMGVAIYEQIQKLIRETATAPQRPSPAR